MRVVAAFTVVIAFAAQAALADVKRHDSIPEALRGTWAPSADACAKSDDNKADDKSRIVLAAKAYTTAGQTCSVDWVSETASARGPIYSAHMRCTSETAKQPSIRNLIIRPGEANQLLIGPAFDSLKTYQKCPATQ